MELPKIGQQCSQTDCNQLDFLPLNCKCGKQFCSEHFNLHVASCETFSKVEVEPRKIENVYKCSRHDCEESSLVPLLCSKCQQHFCIKHRHLTHCFAEDKNLIAAEREKYTAPVRQFNKAKVAVDKHIEHCLDEAKKKGKNTNLANKVQLMKIKSKAKGLKTVPLSERIYFNVTYPEKDDVNPVFVSKNWSVGRAIDAIAVECKLRNDNNKSTGKKLRLFKKDSGEVITKNVADIIQDLINSSILADGENLIIEYVKDDCQYCLNNI